MLRQEYIDTNTLARYRRVSVRRYSVKVDEVIECQALMHKVCKEFKISQAQLHALYLVNLCSPNSIAPIKGIKTGITISQCLSLAGYSPNSKRTMQIRFNALAKAKLIRVLFGGARLQAYSYCVTAAGDMLLSNFNYQMQMEKEFFITRLENLYEGSKIIPPR